MSRDTGTITKTTDREMINKNFRRVSKVKWILKLSTEKNGRIRILGTSWAGRRSS